MDQQLYSNIVSGKTDVDTVLYNWKNKKVKKLNFSSRKI